MCVCAHMGAHMHVYVCACGGLELMSEIILDSLPHYSLRQGLSVDLGVCLELLLVAGLLSGALSAPSEAGTTSVPFT